MSTRPLGDVLPVADPRTEPAGQIVPALAVGQGRPQPALPRDRVRRAQPYAATPSMVSEAKPDSKIFWQSVIASRCGQ